MRDRTRAGKDPLPFILAALLLAASLAGGVAAFAIGFAGAANALPSAAADADPGDRQPR